MNIEDLTEEEFNFLRYVSSLMYKPVDTDAELYLTISTTEYFKSEIQSLVLKGLVMMKPNEPFIVVGYKGEYEDYITIRLTRDCARMVNELYTFEQL